MSFSHTFEHFHDIFTVECVTDELMLHILYVWIMAINPNDAIVVSKLSTLNDGRYSFGMWEFPLIWSIMRWPSFSMMGVAQACASCLESYGILWLRLDQVSLDCSTYETLNCGATTQPCLENTSPGWCQRAALDGWARGWCGWLIANWLSLQWLNRVYINHTLYIYIHSILFIRGWLSWNLCKRSIPQLLILWGKVICSKPCARRPNNADPGKHLPDHIYPLVI